ncbi:hypothetical protein JKF63_06244 [Porcisia hertigi]|uniref:Uncharacterized protein n=1 Tax=Porcisia hertigi TaxID=2761500 RepID=A0A836LEZ1_9TRYP|nr:hypothetical protein JKF63_06244 [Porcisia hertigi]
MNFEDPFANDLSGLRSTVGKQRRVSPSSRSSVSGALAGDPQRSSGQEAAVFPSSISTSSPVGQDAAPPQFESFPGGAALLLGASPAVEPVAGRRARVQLSASGASLGPPSTAGQPSNPTTQIDSTKSPEAPAVSSLSWLDGTDSSQPLVVPGISISGSLRAPPPPRSTGQAFPPSSSPLPFPVADVVPAKLPSFLDFASPGVTPGVAPERSLPPRGPPASALGLSTATGGVSTIVGDAEESRKKEVRDLYTTLDALDMEQQRLEERVSGYQVKEETELLALETSVLVKTTELEEKERELALKRAELRGYTADRLGALASRYAKEMAAQEAEVRSLDGARFEDQLQQMYKKKLATEQVVRELREQAALVLESQPYSETGVRLALDAAAADAAVATTGGTDSSNFTTVAADSSLAKSPSTQLESILHQAVTVLRGYCDKRFRHTRENLVDYVHSSTLDVAHSVRREREQTWMQDAVQHKQLFSRYMVEMMQRYMTFYKERARLKEENIAVLQADTRRMAAELRSQAADRLQQLLRDVTAKVSLSTQRHTQAAEDACALLQKKANTVVEGDVAMADTQRRELESRLLAEAGARRQRHRAEEESLTEQLQRLHRSGEAENCTFFQALVDAAGATSRQRAQPLKEEVLALKSRLLERLRGGESTLGGAASADRMHAEELAHVVRSAVVQETALQKDASLLRQQCDELRRSLMSLCTEVVERLQQARSVQHAHQARINALTRSWEAAHRQNLSAPCSLVLPVSSCERDAADAEYISHTYAAPQDVVSTALLDVLQSKLRARDVSRRSLLESRRKCAAACFVKLEEMRGAQVALQDKGAALWSAAQMQQAQRDINQEMAVEVEKGLSTVAVEQRVVDRDRCATQRECHRIAGMASRLRHEAPQHVLCGPLSLSYQGAPSTILDAMTPHLARTQGLSGVDINIASNTLGIGSNCIAAVRASANAATTPPKNSKGEFPPRSSSVSSPVSEVCQGKRGEEVPASGQKAHFIPDTAEASYGTDTQPWSSELLRAEQQLPRVGGEESSGVLPAAQNSPLMCPLSDCAHVTEQRGEGNAVTLKALTPSSQGAPRLEAGRVHPSSADVPVEAEGDAGRSEADRCNSGFPSDTAEKRRGSKSSSLHAPISPVSKAWAVGSESSALVCTSAAATSPAAFPRQRQQTLNVSRPIRNPALPQPVFSTPEGDRSGCVDVSNQAVANQDGVGMSATSNSTGTRSLDELGDFLALLSITDSTATSSFIS